MKDSIVEAKLNLGDYVEIVKLPITPEELAKLFIKHDCSEVELAHVYSKKNSKNEERAEKYGEICYAINSLNSNGFLNLDEVNYLVKNTMALEEEDLLDKFVAASKVNGDSIVSLLELSDASVIDDYMLFEGVSNNEEFGRLCVEELETISVPEEIEPFFDYEEYGRSQICGGFNNTFGEFVRQTSGEIIGLCFRPECAVQKIADVPDNERICSIAADIARQTLKNSYEEDVADIIKQIDVEAFKGISKITNLKERDEIINTALGNYKSKGR